MKLKQSVEQKQKLSTTLRNWLPILSCELSDIEEVIKPFTQTNPLIEVKSGYEKDMPKLFQQRSLLKEERHSNAGTLEALTVQKHSLYDELFDQIVPPLFPTPRSQSIAYKIVEEVNNDGYFEGDFEKIADELEITPDEVAKIHARFSYIEPFGIGARDMKENFLFQLQSMTLEDKLYKLCEKLIRNLDHLEDFAKEKGYQQAIEVIKTFKNPPAIEFLEEDAQVIPDLMILNDDEGNIEIKLNDNYYPSIEVNHNYGINHPFVQEKLKEAKDLVDAIEMRKATIYKVGLMLVEYQYDYFMGGDMKPLTLQMLADEFGHNASTISRTIANKYITCNRGTIPMKAFFSAPAIAKSEDKEEEISNSAVKEYLQNIIKHENREKPYSDEKLLVMIKEKFDVDIGRRTITKYRLLLNIGSSSERKKMYKLGGLA